MMKLRPCPFCGSDNLLREHADEIFYVVCDGCSGIGAEAETAEWADIKWNRREKAECIMNEEEFVYDHYSKITDELELELHVCKENAKQLIKRLLKHANEIDRLNRDRRWVSIEERLPDERTEVLTVSKNGSIGVCWHVNGLWSTGGEITHWMPLPPLPTQEVQG